MYTQDWGGGRGDGVSGENDDSNWEEGAGEGAGFQVPVITILFNHSTNERDQLEKSTILVPTGLTRKGCYLVPMGRARIVIS